MGDALLFDVFVRCGVVVDQLREGFRERNLRKMVQRCMVRFVGGITHHMRISPRCGRSDSTSADSYLLEVDGRVHHAEVMFGDV